MEINLNNYEVYLIDYLDNKLNPIEVAELLLFLEKHPDIKEEFEGIGSLKVKPSMNDQFLFNDLLIQPFDKDADNINTSNFNTYFIAAHEGDLSEKGIKNLNRFIAQNPSYKNDYRLYSLCKVKSNKKVKFPNTDVLLRKGRSAYATYSFITGIAATLLIMISIYVRMTPDTDKALEQTIIQSIEKQMSSPDKEKPEIKTEKTEKTSTTESKKVTETKENQGSDKLPMKTEKIKVTPKINEPVKSMERRNVILNTTPLMSLNTPRDQYSKFYNDILLSQELSFSESDNIEALASNDIGPAKSSKSARILSSVISSGEQIAEQVPESFNGWFIADIGVKGFNIITNNNYTLYRKLNDKGKIEQLMLKDREKKTQNLN